MIFSKGQSLVTLLKEEPSRAESAGTQGGVWRQGDRTCLLSIGCNLKAGDQHVRGKTTKHGSWHMVWIGDFCPLLWLSWRFSRNKHQNHAQRLLLRGSPIGRERSLT